MNASNLTVNWAMLLRKSSNPKLMLGSESAIDGASAEASGGRMPLVESEGSNDMM
jgi:RNA polymerase I-specific transcription initiation factor RRN6